MKADEIYGTKNPTPHRVLLDTRFELPFGEMPPFGIQRRLCEPHYPHSTTAYTCQGHYRYYFII